MFTIYVYLLDTLADWELEWLERVKAKRHSQETE